VNENVKNIPASVRQRLTNLAKARGTEFQRILVLYALERLLYRLSVSPFANRFILKGASLFSLWFTEPHRRTRDLDLLGMDEPDPVRFATLFQDLCELAVDDDGMRFASDMVKAKPIREENEFGGIRVTLTASLENARVPLQVDIGFGDTTVPEPQVVDFPTLLEGFAAPPCSGLPEGNDHRRKASRAGDIGTRQQSHERFLRPLRPFARVRIHRGASPRGD
jgi:hypothetical protein